VLGAFPKDSVDRLSYFEHLENVFSQYHVPDDIKSTLLQSQLYDRAKALVTRLPRAKLESYEELKQFL
jgi:hypothetical protein